ncbi:MAG: septum formation initiator family protein [Roseburia sp.]|nr:septum formation initiator family protein [Roseburia sp.]MCM1096686.1 septum formation initiator family protein [Ruminococcus flavefaciens]
MAKQRSRNRVTYRKRSQNRFSMFLVTLVVVMIMIAVAVQSVELQRKIDVKVQEEQRLQEQIDAEKARAAELEEFATEVQTKGYIEDIAREKLGLVYEGEILFKEKKQ